MKLEFQNNDCSDYKGFSNGFINEVNIVTRKILKTKQATLHIFLFLFINYDSNSANSKKIVVNIIAYV